MEVAYHELDLAAFRDLDVTYVTHLANHLAVVAGFSGGLDPERHKEAIKDPMHLVTFEEVGKGCHSGVRYFKVTFIPWKNPNQWGKWWIHIRQRDHQHGELVNVCQAFTQDPVGWVTLTRMLIQAGRIVESWALEHQREYETNYLRPEPLLPDPFKPAGPDHEWMQHKHVLGVKEEGK